MNKAEALALLHEISMLCPDLKSSNSITRIDPNRAKITMLPSGFYEVRIKCTITKEFREEIQPIIEKHNLEMIEKENSINIFRPHTNKP